MTAQLTKAELDNIDIIAAANVIYNRTRDLSFRVNAEIMEPMAAWINDPDFMKRHKVMIEHEVPNWAEYKRNQRKWTHMQKQIAAERLRLYWKEVRRKKNFRNELSKILGNAKLSIDSKHQTESLRLNSNAIAEIVTPFSPPATLKADIAREFAKARERPSSYILPWQTILSTSIHNNYIQKKSQNFNSLKQFHPSDKADKIAKLQTLLQMETDNSLSLVQQESFGEIEIEINKDNYKNQSTKDSIIIKDQQGETHKLSWPELNSGQQEKVIKDIINNEIICVT